MSDTPNRYGREGYMLASDLCCRHHVALYRVCSECNQLLSVIADWPEDKPTTALDPPELPTLIGAGNIVRFILVPKP